MTVKIVANGKPMPLGKLADAEIHFGEGLLAGLKLMGFTIWERRPGMRTVTFPARQYVVGGNRRSFALLRAIGETAPQDRLRQAVLQAYAAYEGRSATEESAATA